MSYPRLKTKRIPTHPGEILLHDFMEPHDLSANRLAKALGISQVRLSAIVRGQRAVTADTALRLARYFDTSVELWMGLQAAHDVAIAQAAAAKEIARIKRVA